MKQATSSFKKQPDLESDSDEAKKLRARLMVFALKNHRGILETYNQIPLVANRSNEIITPLLALATFFDSINESGNRYDKIMAAYNQGEENKKTSDDFENLLIEALWVLWEEQGQSDYFNITNSEIGEVIKSIPRGKIPPNGQALQSKVGETMHSLGLVKREFRQTVNRRRITAYLVATEILNELAKKMIPDVWVAPPMRGVSTVKSKVSKIGEGRLLNKNDCPTKIQDEGGNVLF